MRISLKFNNTFYVDINSYLLNNLIFVGSYNPKKIGKLKKRAKRKSN